MRRIWTWLLALGATLAGGFWLGKNRGLAAHHRPKWAAFRLADLADRQAAGDDPWLEFFRTSTLRTGLYVLPAGGTDDQTPHTQDEVYHVLQGRAVLEVDGEDHPVASGAILYVRAGIGHRFHSIEEELQVLVFFAG